MLQTFVRRGVAHTRQIDRPLACSIVAADREDERSLWYLRRGSCRDGGAMKSDASYMTGSRFKAWSTAAALYKSLNQLHH